ncbi:MAG: sigma-54 factor interaction domain-containing protein [bacterium]|nr:sigma-54 factor interaction domain-containing protein [bacterium]
MAKTQQAFDAQSHLDRFLIGESDAIEKLKKEIKLVAPTEAQVLISGETGSGKNLVAKMIHDLHPHREGYQFRRTNIGALVPELAASQLFGHVKGAFTGAERNHEGIIVEADKGTLFLDEISKSSPNVQVMLLTLLEVDRINPDTFSKDPSFLALLLHR